MKTTNSIRLMTSNVLGNWRDGFIENRDDVMAGIYLDLCPDVIALQEFSARYRGEEKDLLSLVAPQYEEILTPVLNRSHNNSTPLLYRTDRVRVLDRGYYFFADGICDNSKSLSWAAFETIDSGKRFVYASTHFIHTSEDGRVIDGQQAKLVCDGLADFYGCPVMIGGDFNSNRTSRSYANLISLGFVDLYEKAPNPPTVKSYHPYPVLDEATHLYVPNPAPIVGDFNNSIDHIFYYGTPERMPKVERFDILTDVRSQIASDHCPVFVDLVLQ